MISIVAQGTAVTLGLWMIGLGVFMAVAPRRALAALAAMGGTPRVHFGEMAIRILAGAALMLVSGASRFPQALWLIGAFLIVSAVVLMLLPRRWHSAYSRWWAARIPVWAVRVVAPTSVLIGAALIWTVV
jgi:predicted membrane chloride channel (bestrophin family)